MSGSAPGRSHFLGILRRVSKRLSRSESQARTRAQLIESATTLYLREGFAATSNDQVAETAGYSRGAVYSNFASKEELALAVLDQHMARQFEAVEFALDHGTVADRFAKFQQWLDQTLGEQQWALLKAELALAARRSPALLGQLAARDEQARATVTVLIERVMTDIGITLPIDPPTLARLILALGRGIALEGVTEPHPSGAWLTEFLRTTLQPITLMLADPEASQP